MSYKSILVNLEIDAPADHLVKLAIDLAKRFDARLIGVSAAEVPPPMVSTEGMVVDVEFLQIQRDDIERRLAERRAEFERLAGPGAEWRGMVADPTRLLIQTACLADLVVTSAPHGPLIGNADRCVDHASLVLRAGRPVLVAADGVDRLLARRILVAWKDTREARRAVADALPLLLRAEEVVVATIDRADDSFAADSVADATAFLVHHGVTARGRVVAERDEGAALANLARTVGADLVVSGAYGHSRLREWVFGGVTRSLLDDGGLNRFMSN